MQPNPISGFVFFCGVMLLAIALYAWQRRTTTAAREFALFTVFVVVYVLGYGLELSSLDLPTMLFWNKVQYVGIYFFPPLFLIFILRYIGRDQWLTQRNIILLFIIPVLLLGAKFTDEYFHWIYSTVTIDSSGPIPLLAFTRGPLYLLGAIYNLIWVVFGMFLLWQKRKFSSALYRHQATLMIFSALGPLLIYLIYISGFQPIPELKNIDLNCFVYIVWVLGISWTMFRYRLFDLTPIAREALIENLSVGLVVVDIHHRIVDTNPAAMKLFAWHSPPIGQFIDRRIAEWIASIPSHDHNGAASIEVRFDSGGEDRCYEVDIPVLNDRQGQRIGYLILLHDITERKAVEAELHELTLTDELTGLNNRRGFTMLATQYLQMAQRMNLPATLCYIDLDDLKRINDTFGHPAGDQTLVDTASILKNTFRSADILARIGGDEFVVLTIESDEKSGERMLDRLDEQMAAFNDQPARRFAVAFSMGMAHYNPAAPSSLETLLERADRAMYIQKQGKKNGQKASA